MSAGDAALQPRRVCGVRRCARTPSPRQAQDKHQQGRVEAHTTNRVASAFPGSPDCIYACREVKLNIKTSCSYSCESAMTAIEVDAVRRTGASAAPNHKATADGICAPTPQNLPIARRRSCITRGAQLMVRSQWTAPRSQLQPTVQHAQWTLLTRGPSCHSHPRHQVPTCQNAGADARRLAVPTLVEGHQAWAAHDKLPRHANVASACKEPPYRTFVLSVGLL